MRARDERAGSFRYTIYLQATPEKVWQGLTDPAVTKRYWRHHKAGVKTFRSKWTTGSTWDLEHPEIGLVVSDPDQVILEADPYRRLSYTWHSFTPEWAVAVGMDEQTAAEWRAGPRSWVVYDMEPVGQGAASLTVTHGGFAPGSPVLEGIEEGWPAVLSSLKTLLETGTELRTA